MSILPIVKQDLEENLQVDDEIIESETEEQSEEEVEQIIEVKQRKKAVRNEIFDIKDEPEPEPVEPEPVEPEPVEPEPVKETPKKRRPAKFYDEGYREGEYYVIVDKNGNKRWLSDTNRQKATERLMKVHEQGGVKRIGRKKKVPSVEVQLKEALEKQEQNKNNFSEEFIQKYQEDLMNVVKTASLNAVEEYDTKRKARKAEKKAQQRAEIVQSQMRSKLEGLKQPVKYGEVGYFDSCWD